MVYRWCIVPQCKNTSISTRTKNFISVPFDQKWRKLWIQAVRRDKKEFSKKTAIFVCEDHFNLEEDMANYMEWKMMGVKKLMKKGVVPHIFDCQLDRKRSFSQPERPAVLKRRRLKLISDILRPSTSVDQPSVFEEVKEETEMLVECQEDHSKSVGVQVHLKASHRSKGIQCNLGKPTTSRSTSP